MQGITGETDKILELISEVCPGVSVVATYFEGGDEVKLCLRMNSVDEVENILEHCNAAGLPVPEVRMYGYVRDASGNVAMENSEDLKLMPLDTWHNWLTEDDRAYLLLKHGEQNKPTGENDEHYSK